MRSSIIPAVAFLLTLSTAAYGGDLGMIRLSLVEGGAQVLIQDSTDWTDGTINVPLDEGDRLWVPDGGKAELQIRGGVYVRIDGGTALDILQVAMDTVQFYLDRGHAYINNRRGGVKASQIDTPLTSIRSYDNSVMMIDVTEDGVTEVSVLKGYITAENRSGATQVGSGYTLTIREDQAAELAPIAAPDDWERWNTDRDRTHVAWGESSRYLPDEMHDYSGDFDENGRWDYVGDYGYVWSPVVAVADWAPYTSGRWVWIRGNYVWIAYDPWCWGPCHYGRWVFLASRGWCWVPPPAGSAYWGPGYVGWMVTPSYVAWVPLAPGEVYYGYGYYGPGSVNITTININTVAVKRDYLNAHNVHAVNMVKRETFGTGRREFVRGEKNPFLESRREGREVALAPPQARPTQPITLVPPDVRIDTNKRQRPPEQEHGRQEYPGARREAPPQVRPVQPVPTVPTAPPAVRTDRPRETPPMVRQGRDQQRPPERVIKNRPDTLKNERRMVKEREGSVFRSQPPENLPVKKMPEPRPIIRAKPVQPQQTDGQNPKKQQGDHGQGPEPGGGFRRGQ
jgi:hypothetical protein